MMYRHDILVRSVISTDQLAGLQRSGTLQSDCNVNFNCSGSVLCLLSLLGNVINCEAPS